MQKASSTRFGRLMTVARRVLWLIFKAGDRKDSALAAAKRFFIRSGKTDSHPFFWAGFIGIGDMSMIKF